MPSLRCFLPPALAFPLLAFAAPARAGAPSPDLMKRLAAYAADFEAMKTHASYALAGKLEQVDKDDKPESTKEMTARIDADGTNVKLKVIKYVEDGEDKTDEARQKAHESEEKRKKESSEDKEKRNVKMPFLESEQERYAFDQVETDRADPSRVRITFVPKEKAENTIEGSAWIDTKTATPISAGFKLSKTSMWVDYVHVQVEFAAPTALGPAVSRVSMRGKGGILFFRKRFRVEATLSEYRILR